MSLTERLKLGSELKSTVSIDKFNTLYTYNFQNNKKCKGNILGARAWLGQNYGGVRAALGLAPPLRQIPNVRKVAHVLGYFTDAG